MEGGLLNSVGLFEAKQKLSELVDRARKGKNGFLATENPQGLRQTTSERPGLQPGLKRKKLRRQGEFRDAATGPTRKNVGYKGRTHPSERVGHPKKQKQIPRRPPEADSSE